MPPVTYAKDFKEYTSAKQNDFFSDFHYWANGRHETDKWKTKYTAITI